MPIVQSPVHIPVSSKKQDNARITLPLTAAQPGIWFAGQIDSEAQTFVVAHYAELEGSLDAELLSKAIRIALAEVDTIHAHFENGEDGPVQSWPSAREPGDVAAPDVIDLTNELNPAGRAQAFMRTDLEAAPAPGGDGLLYRHMLLRVGEARWFWYQRYHHLCLDGYSFAALTRRIVQIQTALAAGQQPALAQFTSFAEVVNEYKSYKTSDIYERDRSFWNSYLAEDDVPVSFVSADTAQESTANIDVLRLRFKLGAEILVRLAEPGQRFRVVQPEMLMAGVAAYIHRMTASETIIVGMPFMRRMGSAAINATGPVVNVLPVKLRFDNTLCFGELAQQLSKELRKVRKHQRYDAEQVQRDLGLVGSGQALYGPTINFKVYDGDLALAGVKSTTHVLAAGPVEDIEFGLWFEDDTLTVELSANPARYTADDLQLHADRLEAFMRRLIDNVDEPIRRLDLQSAAEVASIKHWSRGPQVQCARQAHTVLDIFEQSAFANADETAIADCETSIDFAALSAASARLGHFLISRGVGPGDVVATALPRRVDAIVALLGILASGAAWMPLDPDYPVERLSLMCADAEPVLVLTHKNLRTAVVTDTEVLCLDDPAIVEAMAVQSSRPVEDANRLRVLRGDDLAYIIYTSGSTGKPKGVMVPHKGLLNLLLSHEAGLFGEIMSKVDRRRVRACHAMSLSFDSSWEQVIWMLLGHELHLCDEEQRRDAQALVDLIVERQIDTIDLSPSMLQQMIDCGLLHQQHQPVMIQVGGEAVSSALWRELRRHPHIHFHNFYGPTEYSVDTLSASVMVADVPVIGRPVANSTVHILDNLLQPVPIGVTGELYIAGPGLAHGYLGRAGLTASRFVANPFDGGSLMYRTGDLARWRSDGQVDYAGRSDHQVKIRGFRVEPGEIEHIITSLEGVTAALVLAEPFGSSLRLLGWFTGSADETDVQVALAQSLPDYMLPSSLSRLEAWPLNVNGKVERTLLPRPEQRNAVSKAVAYADEQERLVCESIAAVIGMDAVRADDDFFGLGGDSISAMALCTALRKVGLVLRPRDVFGLRRADRMKTALQPLEAQPQMRMVDVDGEVSGLPIVKWYAENHGLATRFSQAVLLRVPAKLARKSIEQALEALYRAHPSLRAKATHTGLTIPPLPLDFSASSLLLEIANPGDARIAEEAGIALVAASNRLDPASGIMLQAVHWPAAEDDGSLMLVIHHLVTDGVSWRIILAELENACHAAMAGTVPFIAREEASIRDWAKMLGEQVPMRRNEQQFWRDMLADKTSIMPRKLDKVRDTYGSALSQRTLFDADLTRLLLSNLPSAYRMTVEETILTAVTRAFSQVFAVERLRFSLESHGRHMVDDRVDPSRTVGWFTAEYPVLFNLGNVASVQESVLSVKQALRRVPDHGLGYGVLRYLDTEAGPELARLEKINPPEVLFNYLGRFVSRNGYWTPQAVGGRFADAFAVDVDPTMRLMHGIEINAFIDEAEIGPRLAINWTLADGLFEPGMIEALHDAIAINISALADHAWEHPEKAADTLVAADTPGLTENELLDLRERHGSLDAVLPLLPLQEGLLFHTQLHEAASKYNSITRIDFRGSLDKSLLCEALDGLLRRFPQLAARFETGLQCGSCHVLPLAPGRWPLDEYDISTEADKAAALGRIEHTELDREFLPSEGRLFHASLVHRGEKAHTLFINVHHLVIDGWSTPILLRELLAAYGDGPDTLEKTRVAYSDVINALATRDLSPARDAWKETLEGARPTLLFGTAVAAPEVHEMEFVIPDVLEQALLARCRENGLTLNTLMQGVWGATLSLLTGRSDVLFGTPVSGRFSPIDGIDEHIGLFSNTVPVRIRLDPALPLLQQLAASQAVQGGMLEHDSLGLAEIQQIAGGSTLFDTLLVSENYPQTDALTSREYAGVRITGLNNRGYTHYPLTLMVLREEKLRLLVEYRNLLREPEQLMTRIQMLLEHIAYNGDQAWSEFAPLVPAEQALIDATNATDAPFPEASLRDLLDRQAKATPGAIALADDNHSLTYVQLRKQVTQLAMRMQSAGVGPGTIVAIALPRSVLLTIAIHAVIEAGAAYLPLDSGYPDERLHMMIGDAKPKLIITASALQQRFSALGEIMLLDGLAEDRAIDFLPPALTPDDPAYLIYTSGSTGRPKGVLVSHRAIVNRLAWMQNEYMINVGDVVLQKTPASFDVSVWEFFWPLMEGAALYMAAPEAHRDPDELSRIIKRENITVMHFVPSMLAAFLEWCKEDTNAKAPLGQSLRHVFCSGEALPRGLADRYQSLFAGGLHNLYGPTEAAVDVTYKPASEQCASSANVPIGRPVWNTQLRILDHALRPSPIGVPGDLYLCGVQLADYYLDRAELTSTRFVADPFADGQRMYRTGDIAKWMDNGEVDYLGRSDDQLKIRGQRIELGEIEAVLKAQPGIINAVVNPCVLGTAGNGGDARQLVAYVIPDDLDMARLKMALAERVPAHMVPTLIVELDVLPLSPNGKLDRKALPVPSSATEGGRAPRPGLESRIATEFAAILELPIVGAEDDFFTLGGHSLLAMRLASKLRASLGMPLSVGQVMMAPSVAKLAALLSAESSDKNSSGFGAVLQLRAGQGNPLFCFHPASGFAWQYNGFARYLPANLPVVGLQSPREDGVIANSATLDEACERHLETICKLQPRGPYHLIGYSLGGTLAQGVAARLRELGEEVAFLGLFDTYPPEGQDWTGNTENEAGAEADREREQFVAATEDEIGDEAMQAEKTAMFADIVANYADAVKLLAQGRTPYFDGEAVLFVAKKTLPGDWDVEGSWAGHLKALDIHEVDCAHEDILSPETLVGLGPLLAKLLADVRSLG
ncbi:non-ribosomal peptide synthetase [Phyllobacterium sp. YR531]|uniref:amino acid adenylation domain-containing protein n=1 Tax=Phyllobacterium sp. YR531 TaxID=1144343 RepID=UPI00026F5BB7|nr:non-ribosomal peptide synthetase [Phyllobacterium sp. YR531]EJN00004.1 non-ribosomal peptide synthase/amino acid adenylation enzyme [Phyllobacterium sp. YR531]